MRWTVFAALLVTAASGCGDAVVPIAIPQAGRYELRAIQGSPLPATLAPTVDVLSGELTLERDGSCHGETVLWVSQLNDPAHEALAAALCTWGADGAELRFSWTTLQGAVYGESVGTLLGGRLTVFRPTGIICVTVPCPAGWEEEYQKVEDF